MTPEASIVVRTFNEARHLPRLIEGLEAQHAQDFETVLVDSGSTDETVEIARGAFDAIVEIESRDFTFGYSLNRGIAAATGRFVVIVSAHTWPAHERWLGALLRPFTEHADLALVYGNQFPVDVTKPSERHEFEQLFGASPRLQYAPDYYCNNANAAIPRSLWERHPYDEALTGLEDQAWAKHWMDQGMAIAYEPEAAIHHSHNESWEQLERRYYREAFARRRFGVAHRRDVPRRLAAGARLWVGDLSALRARGELDRRSLVQASRYRSRQTRGEVRGLMHDYDPVHEHEELFFDRGDSAVVISQAGQAALEQRPLPVVKPSDVLLRVAYVGICATDLEVADGSLGYYRDGTASFPIIPGHEYSGVVVKTGANVSGVRVGDRVVGECILGCGRCMACRAGNPIACKRRREVGVINHDGAYAEHVLLPSDHVHRLDSAADLRRHALVEPLAVVHKALGRLALDGGPVRCAVVGAGPIGNLCAQVLARRGHRVTAIDDDPARLAALPAAIRERRERIEGLDEFAVVVEGTGSRSALEAVLDGAGAGTRILLLGFPYGEMPFNFERIVATDRIVVGSVGSGPDDFRAAIELVGKLDLDQFTGASFPLERFQEAWDAHRRRDHLKVMLEVRP